MIEKEQISSALIIGGELAIVKNLSQFIYGEINYNHIPTSAGNKRSNYLRLTGVITGIGDGAGEEGDRLDTVVFDQLYRFAIRKGG